ncbi:MAG TPA: hypothetical protein VF162_02915 [Streptosporangiaceae bacterium]
MYETHVKPRPVPFPAGAVDGLLAAAARAPSILNTQPWQFRVTPATIELFADPDRKLSSDMTGREMVISCGAALYGLRLAIRAIGYQPVVRLLPDPMQPHLLACVRLGEPAPPTEGERRMLGALPHRHTHRGAYLPEPLPRGLLIGLQHDAVAEHSGLALIDQPVQFNQLASLVARSSAALSADARAKADVARWVQPPGSRAKDGVPASAIFDGAAPHPGWLAQRDLANGQSAALPEPDRAPPAATAILVTDADNRLAWIRAGQALHRVLVHAASQWVFATLYSQPLESPAARSVIKSSLRLPGAPQVILQLGVAGATRPTPRRTPRRLRG